MKSDALLIQYDPKNQEIILRQRDWDSFQPSLKISYNEILGISHKILCEKLCDDLKEASPNA